VSETTALKLEITSFCIFHFLFYIILFLIISVLKDHVKSVLRISSAHNKVGPTDINIAQILFLSNCFELKRTRSSLYEFTIANQKSVRYSVSMDSMPYFTNIAVQNVNKGFVNIMDLTWSLNIDICVCHIYFLFDILMSYMIYSFTFNISHVDSSVLLFFCLLK
jgi:hypothetical protein